MSRVLGVVVGVLMLVAGAWWTFASLGWVGDGGEGRLGATVGPIVAGFGLALVLVAARGPR